MKQTPIVEIPECRATRTSRETPSRLQAPQSDPVTGFKMPRLRMATVAVEGNDRRCWGELRVEMLGFDDTLRHSCGHERVKSPVYVW